MGGGEYCPFKFLLGAVSHPRATSPHSTPTFITAWTYTQSVVFGYFVAREQNIFQRFAKIFHPHFFTRGVENYG